MTDQTKPMDAERLAEIEARLAAVLREPYDREADADYLFHVDSDVADLLAELARLRAVIEEARARIANRKFGDDGTRIWIEDYMDDLGRLLDRGLKGAGNE